MLSWLLAAAALVAVVGIWAWLAERARARRLAREVIDAIEPYLRRKAAEAGLVGATTTWTSRATPEQIVGHSARVARQLLELERLGPQPTTTRELEVAQTQPGDFVITDRQRK
jgi:hypothetical protein